MTDPEYVDAIGKILIDPGLTDTLRVYRVMCLLELDKVTRIKAVLTEAADDWSEWLEQIEKVCK